MNKPITIDLECQFGKPTISGTGIVVYAVADRFVSGDSPEFLAEDWRISIEQIYDALRFTIATPAKKRRMSNIVQAGLVKMHGATWLLNQKTYKWRQVEESAA